jgi:hypothetical protein
MSEQLPGIPAGYEAVRFGIAHHGEPYMDEDGDVVHWNYQQPSAMYYLIVRKIPPKIRTVKVAEFATWWDDSPDAVRVEVMSQSKVDQLVAAKRARRIGPWREIEIREEDR